MFRFFEKIEMENGKKIPVRKISHFVAKGKTGKRWIELARGAQPIEPEELDIPDEVTTVKVYCYTKDGKRYVYRTYYNQPDIQPQVIEAPPQPQYSNIREALAPVLAQLQVISELRETLREINETINPQTKVTDIVKELAEHIQTFQQLQQSLMGVTNMLPNQQNQMPWFIQLFVNPVYREAVKDTIVDIIGELKGSSETKKEEVDIYVPRPKSRRKVKKTDKRVGRDETRRSTRRDTEIHREPERERPSEDVGSSIEGQGDSTEHNSDVSAHGEAGIQESGSEVSVGDASEFRENGETGEVDDTLAIRPAQIKEIIEDYFSDESEEQKNESKRKEIHTRGEAAESEGMDVSESTDNGRSDKAE